MSDNSGFEYGLWELAVLAVLREHPMHPYDILRVLKERRKDDVLVLKRGSLYHAIRRLAADGLIAEGETTRDGLRPERTTYTVTPAGEKALGDWLKQLVSVPRREPSTFMAAMSFLVYLEPAEAIRALEQRREQLEATIARFDQVAIMLKPKIGRLHLLESEYARAMCAAEAAWIGELLADLRGRKLTWDLKAILRQLRAFHADRTKRKNHHENK